MNMWLLIREKGKSFKKVAYFLAKSKFRELVLEKSTGAGHARWFEMTEIPKLRIYNDIIPLIAKGVEIISSSAKRTVAPHNFAKSYD